MATTEHRPTERVLDILELLSNSEEGNDSYRTCQSTECPKK